MLISSPSPLRRLIGLRWLAIAGQAAALVLAPWFGLDLPRAPLLITILTLSMINFGAWWRLKRRGEATDHEVFAHIAVDVSAWSLALYWTGGATNPFVSLLLVYLVLTAALLPMRYTWSMVALTCGIYSLLLFFYVPLMSVTHDHHDMAMHEGVGFRMHIVGMWFNFVVSALLIAAFAARMLQSVRERDQALAAAREDILRNERIVALGTLAAGAAHELGTPLATIAVISRELESDLSDQPDAAASISLLREQVTRCKTILSDLLARAGGDRLEAARTEKADQYLHQLLDKWNLMRPGLAPQLHWPGGAAPTLPVDLMLDQALLNLLNNAADASPDSIEIGADWDARHFILTIRDRGPGFDHAAMQQAGKDCFTTKPPDQGIGIGLFLANATLSRHGGEVRWFNREGGGAVTEVRLPRVQESTP